MNRIKISEPKPTLNVSISPHLYRRLKKEIGDRKVSNFVEKAIAKELNEYDDILEKEQRDFQKKLIDGYKRAAQNKSLREEEKIWEEVIEDIIN